jgi:tetratricopeptide (TPR) repeat protein/transcriptional regulator with XRE-family HTH domain
MLPATMAVPAGGRLAVTASGHSDGWRQGFDREGCVAKGAEETVGDDRQVVFGRLLRAHRLRLLLTQEQLAERSGISPRAIRELERGRVRRPRGDSLRLLADALGLAGAIRLEFQAAARDPDAARAVAAGQPAIPCQLPPDIADFTGRAEVVARLDALLAGDLDGLRPAGPAVSTIAGGGGVGKTTLAVHVAHRVRHRFPDGQLYVDLRGAEASPAGPGEVLGRLLRALGVEATAIPEGLDERAAMYRSLLADRRVLVVLDNAAGEAQLLPLLPGSPTCGVLVTSRTPLTGLGRLRPLGLAVLPANQAVELLGRIVGTERVAAEPQSAAELARLCGCLPLALRVAGARLAARPHWQLAQLVARLADERRRLDELAYGHLAVRASLTLSYQALEPAARVLLRRLGLLEAPEVAAWTGAALLDSSIEQAQELTERLVDARLLEVAGRDATGQVRYRLHDLVGVFAHERAAAEDPPAERRAALARAFGAWLHLAERADALLGNPFLEPVYGPAARWPVDQQTAGRLLGDPLAFLEAERVGLVAAVTQAGRLGMAGVAWELCSALTQFLATRLYLDDWCRCTEQALAVARRAADAHGEGAVLLSLGHLHAVHGRHQQALECWQAALGNFERLGEGLGRAMGLAAVGLYRFDRGSLQQRRQQIEEALATLDQVGDGNPRARACVLRCLGILLHNHGRLELADRCFQQALELFRRLGSRLGEAELLYRLGVVRIKQGRDRQAVAVLQQTLAAMRQHGDRLSASCVEVHLGTALVHLGRETQAWPLLEPWTHDGNPYLRGVALRALGELAQAHGRHHRARTVLGEALRLFRELDIPIEEAVTARTLVAVGYAHPAGLHALPPPTA